MIYLFKNSCHLEFFSPVDPKISPHMCLDITYPPAKFDGDYSNETLVIVKQNKCLSPAHRNPQCNNQVSPCENLVNKTYMLD